MSTNTPASFEWRNEYSVNVAEIDSQHRNLLVLLNKVNAHESKSSAQGSQSGTLMTVLEELNEYAYYHFMTEETLMREHLPSSESAAKHIAAHRSYWTIITEFKKRLTEKDPKVGKELLEYLNRWWIKHILETDRQLGVELNQLGIH